MDKDKIILLLMMFTIIVILFVSLKNEIEAENYINNNIETINNNIDEMDEHHHKYEKCLNDIDTDKKEDIAMNEVNKVSWCIVYDEYIENCSVTLSYWSDNSTAIQIEHLKGSLIENKEKR